ncbi:conserved hypothetical protein [Parafrankia sp. Ea1.12]|nr:conserved hypothetical protein [Parafrankia sp. Ea1.12]
MTEPAGGQPGWIVDDPNTVTPEWMTGALRRGGTDTEVVGLRHQPVGGGQLSSSYRFHLDVRPGGTGVRPGGTDQVPSSVVLKMAAGSPEGRGQIAPGYRSEVGYYTRFAPSARIRVPRCGAPTSAPTAGASRWCSRTGTRHGPVSRWRAATSARPKPRCVTSPACTARSGTSRISPTAPTGYAGRTRPRSASSARSSPGPWPRSSTGSATVSHRPTRTHCSARPISSLGGAGTSAPATR